ncbi:MAG: lytic transglycosylase domain-containing protein [Chloroflexi bacterium]|nr:lytic transglycosylase domain-containing protein [Chloroflexota bacterium]
MTHFDPATYSKKTTSGTQSGGCLFSVYTPLLAVIAASVVLAISLSQMGIASSAPLQASWGDAQIAPFFSPGVQYWYEKIATWSQKWGLDPNLVATVMQIESCGDPDALSGAGAMGLFQVMPYHFAAGEDPYKSGTNAMRGLSYLKNALEARGGDVRLGLAGYNTGISGAKGPESAWPGETVRYVYWGVGIYSEAQKGETQSDRLDEWLAYGGASLCSQAAKNLGIIP